MNARFILWGLCQARPEARGNIALAKLLLAVLLICLLSACAPSPPSSELVVVGRLVRISKTPAGCGIAAFAAVAEYSDIKVLEGQYPKDVIFVVHACPEMKRTQYTKEGGDLQSFQAGDYHELYLTKQVIFHEAIVSGDVRHPEEFTYFCRKVNLYAESGD